MNTTSRSNTVLALTAALALSVGVCIGYAVGHSVPGGGPGPAPSAQSAPHVPTAADKTEAGVEAAGVTPASRFADDLDIDSLGLLTIATQVEERLGVTLDDSLIPNLPTVGALIDLVSTQRA